MLIAMVLDKDGSRCMCTYRGDETGLPKFYYE